MKKLIILVMMATITTALFTALPAGASASSPSALNQGSCTAHTSGMPSVDGHVVPGLASTPFAGAEVPGHMYVPDPPGC